MPNQNRISLSRLHHFYSAPSAIRSIRISHGHYSDTSAMIRERQLLLRNIFHCANKIRQAYCLSEESIPAAHHNEYFFLPPPPSCKTLQLLSDLFSSRS